MRKRLERIGHIVSYAGLAIAGFVLLMVTLWQILFVMYIMLGGSDVVEVPSTYR